MTTNKTLYRREDFQRRSFIKAATMTGVGLGGLSAATGTVGADTTVSGGGDNLQTAIDNASSGETLTVVDSATYNAITIDKSLTVKSAEDADPTIAGPGGITTAVSVEANDVTFKGFTVTNDGGLLGIKVERSHDGATIQDNHVKDLGPTGFLGVTGIIVGQGDHSGIEIKRNTIENLDQEINENSQIFPTVNGILIDADNNDPSDFTDSEIVDNTIKGLESDIAPLGIVIQHHAEKVTIKGNEITGLLAAYITDSDDTDDGGFGEFDTFAQGINIGSPSTDKVDVILNSISDIQSDDGFDAEAVKIDGDAAGLTLRQNSLEVDVGVKNDDGDILNAKCNWWGSADGPDEASDNTAPGGDGDVEDGTVIGPVDYEPWLTSSPDDSPGNGAPCNGRNRGP